ncbi:MAG: HD domain-containing protein [Chitinophagales bacterium]|nr:HD domain-containing protein [Chitinophagales bacterium]
MPTPTPFTPEQVANEIIYLFDEHGDSDYIGEDVSQIQHMTQCATLAQRDAQPEEVILAALLHDIGHLCEYVMTVNRMDKFGVVDHEFLGQAFLRERGFSDSLCKMVASHVNAKRYLTYRDPLYYDLLSQASKETLEIQGGRMTPDEALTFEMDPLHLVYVQLRKWDDQAKNPSISPLPIDAFKDMIVRHLQSQQS